MQRQTVKPQWQEAALTIQDLGTYLSSRCHGCCSQVIMTRSKPTWVKPRHMSTHGVNCTSRWRCSHTLSADLATPFLTPKDGHALHHHKHKVLVFTSKALHRLAVPLPLMVQSHPPSSTLPTAPVFNIH